MILEKHPAPTTKWIDLVPAIHISTYLTADELSRWSDTVGL